MSNSKTAATQRYKAKTYDRLAIEVPKGKREIIKAFASQKGISLNAYVLELIREDMKEAWSND